MNVHICALEHQFTFLLSKGVHAHPCQFPLSEAIPQVRGFLLFKVSGNHVKGRGKSQLNHILKAELIIIFQISR